jgi:hypothetical protein
MHENAPTDEVYGKFVTGDHLVSFRTDRENPQPDTSGMMWRYIVVLCIGLPLVVVAVDQS